MFLSIYLSIYLNIYRYDFDLNPKRQPHPRPSHHNSKVVEARAQHDLEERGRQRRGPEPPYRRGRGRDMRGPDPPYRGGGGPCDQRGRCGAAWAGTMLRRGGLDLGARNLGAPDHRTPDHRPWGVLTADTAGGGWGDTPGGDWGLRAADIGGEGWGDTAGGGWCLRAADTAGEGRAKEAEVVRVEPELGQAEV